jgi:aldehyde:ferredoxin oxidoreductase
MQSICKILALAGSKSSKMLLVTPSPFSIIARDATLGGEAAAEAKSAHRHPQ